MLAYHSDPKIKEKYLKRVQEHFLADEIIKGKYWEGGKGCALGCTIHSSDHSKYEDELGIPKWLAKLEDTIFEGLPNKEAKKFPALFLESIKVGVDLDRVKAPFIIFVLESTLENFDHKKYPYVVDAIRGSIALWQRDDTESAAWSAAWSAARSAAESAAESAAWSAAESAARSAAWSAAWSAAEGTAWRTAWNAAESAAESAAWRTAAWRTAAHSDDAYSKFATKLIKLIKDL